MIVYVCTSRDIKKRAKDLMRDYNLITVIKQNQRADRFE